MLVQCCDVEHTFDEGVNVEVIDAIDGLSRKVSRNTGPEVVLASNEDVEDAELKFEAVVTSIEGMTSVVLLLGLDSVDFCGQLKLVERYEPWLKK